MHELPLVFFTVLGQTAVGMMVLAFIAGLLGQITHAQRHKINLVAMILLAVGMVLGGLHMGQPLRAFNLLFGLFRSPMSNEIVLSGLYFGGVCLTVALSATRLRATLQAKLNVTVTDTLHQWLNGITALLGLAFAWSITQVYQLATVPAWNSHYTSLHLWLTVAISGGMCALGLGVKRLASLVVIIGAVVSLATRTGYMAFLTEQVPDLVSAQMVYWYTYWFSIAIALALAVWVLLKKQAVKPLLFSGALIMIIGELASRIAFYNLWWITM
ncbi:MULTISPECIES: dimethyl sulfoxide reductase anchor subunit family protein [Vibrio]|uniref:Dimethyl sulfoxide reductase anchor subunit n=1 Tax=Vibrio chanodichtyis TaxID=3027932 RepID=A0ABT5V4A8_9VIBR|nr:MULTISPECIES: DmsC/YnfH family molybdoenzyme membrane anchor subunit [Vibrio]MDE1515160.1 dimethyl sulfoxide reductase anchor subunit [Vibrio chanodichtyis]